MVQYEVQRTMTDPILLEAELQAVELMVGEPEVRGHLCTRLSMEGMTLDEVLLLIGYARRRARPDVPGDVPGLLFRILTKTDASWRAYVADLRAAARAPEAPASPEGQMVSRGRGPLCAHGRRPLAEGCDACNYQPGASTSRAGCWNFLTKSFNAGEPDGEDWQRLCGKTRKRPPKDPDAERDRQREATVRMLRGTASEADLGHLVPNSVLPKASWEGRLAAFNRTDDECQKLDRMWEGRERRGQAGEG